MLPSFLNADVLKDFPLQFTRFQLVLAFAALLILRLTVGYHFFKEGTSKLKQYKGFDASGFLSSAKGPFAGQFHAMVDDFDGKERLSVTVDKSQTGIGSIVFDTQPTEDLWQEFRDRADGAYHFGDTKLVEKLQAKRATLAEEIKAFREKGDAGKARELEIERSEAETDIIQIRNQPKRSEEILADSIESYKNWLTDNKGEIVAYYGTQWREDGFAQDGQHSSDAALWVDSLRYQVDTIKGDRKKKAYAWYAEVDSIWDAYESQINSLATTEQVKRVGGTLDIFRHYSQPYSPLKLINIIIPWFDTIVGALLILGLFTRLASGAAALFLISVILTQPPWIPGTAPTYFYAIELAALLLLFATYAGRFGGLDFFLASSPKVAPQKKPTQPETAALAS